MIKTVGLKKIYRTDEVKTTALNDVNIAIQPGEFVSIMGPSGCGKSTFLRCFNRMNDLIDIARITGGSIHIDGVNIYDESVDVIELRKHVGMVFQKSNPFPKSIYENIAYGLRIQGVKSKKVLDEVVEDCLRSAALWDEVKDRLNESALGMSGGQQQRLCIARALAVKPKILLMDEPCSALDPIATATVETLIDELREKYTIIIVTHSMQQAARVSQKTAFFHLGELVEYGDTDQIFSAPREERTQNYITGRIG